MPLLESVAVFLRPPDPRPMAEIEREIVDELEFHLEMRTRDNLLAGMSEDAARGDAARRFGDFEQIRRVCRRVQLGERIMLQRMQAVMTVLLLLAVAVLGWQFYRGQQANQAALAHVAATLEQMQRHDESADLGAETRVDAVKTLAAQVKELTLEASTPRVVETVPKAGDQAVDPSLTEIRVVFNKPMQNGSWSWSQESEQTFPEMTGEPRYLDDQKTCVLPVVLAPDKEYVIWLNSQYFGNFRDRGGRSATPYKLAFRTRPN